MNWGSCCHEGWYISLDSQQLLFRTEDLSVRQYSRDCCVTAQKLNIESQQLSTPRPVHNQNTRTWAWNNTVVCVSVFNKTIGKTGYRWLNLPQMTVLQKQQNAYNFLLFKGPIYLCHFRKPWRKVGINNVLRQLKFSWQWKMSTSIYRWKCGEVKWYRRRMQIIQEYWHQIYKKNPTIGWMLTMVRQ